MLQTFLSRSRQSDPDMTPAPAELPPGQDRIPVRRAALRRLEEDPGALLADIFSATRFLTGGLAPGQEDVPLAVRQLFQAESYRRKVISSGHSDFVAEVEQDLSLRLADIGQVLNAAGAGADAHRALFDEMQTWVALYPEDADDLIEDEPALVALDAPFRDLERTVGLAGALARWIAQQPVLEAVEEAEWSTALRALARSTPERAARHASASRAAIARALTDPARLGLGIAAASLPQPEPLVRHGPCVRLESGTQEGHLPAWPLQSIAGLRLGRREGPGFSYYEAIPRSGRSVPRAPLRADRLDDHLLWYPHVLGARLAHVPLTRVRMASEICKELQAPVAIHALLESLPQPASATCVSLHAVQRTEQGRPVIIAMIVADMASRAFAAQVTPEGAVLLSEPAHERLVTLSREQIEAT